MKCGFQGPIIFRYRWQYPRCVVVQMIEKIEELLIKGQPDWVMVYGDTNFTLAASKSLIKIAHVEVGLHSFNMRMLEEVN
jgi:UDP-GlcNAc3NAcA epimerase